MKEILEALEIDAETKLSILEAFKAVKEKAEADVASKEKLLEAYSEEALTEMKEALQEEFDAKTAEIVEAFIAENKEAIEQMKESLDTTKLVESVKVALIPEAKEAQNVQVQESADLEELKELKEQVLVLESNNTKLMVTGAILEAKLGLDKELHEVFEEKAKDLDVESVNAEEILEALDALSKEIKAEHELYLESCKKKDESEEDEEKAKEEIKESVAETKESQAEPVQEKYVPLAKHLF